MEKKEMLEMLVNHYCDGNKAKFAAMLGIKPQAFSMWFARNSFDAELLYTKCEHISADWLLSNGAGEMIKQTPPVAHEEGADFLKQQIEFLNSQVTSLSERNEMLEEELVQQLREKKANVG